MYADGSDEEKVVDLPEEGVISSQIQINPQEIEYDPQLSLKKQLGLLREDESSNTDKFKQNFFSEETEPESSTKLDLLDHSLFDQTKNSASDQIFNKKSESESQSHVELAGQSNQDWGDSEELII